MGRGERADFAGIGFEALATTSAGLRFARPRATGAVTREELFAHCRAIADVTNLPVAAISKNCYGDDPKTVAETIRLASAAGIVGGSVEDASGDDRHPIYDFTGLPSSASPQPWRPPGAAVSFMLTARAENFLHGRADLDDTIRRLQAFAEAGADVLYAPALPSLEAIKAVCAAVAPRPVNVLAGMKSLAFSVAELAARVCVASALVGVVAAAYGALISAAQEMKQKGTFNLSIKRRRLRGRRLHDAEENSGRDGIGKMFETLTEKLQRAFKNLRGQGKLTEEHLDAALAEIREALLEGDVNLGVADEFIAQVRQKALGSEVLLQLSPDQQVVKIVRDELAELLGREARPQFSSRPPSVWLICGCKAPEKPPQRASSENGSLNTDTAHRRFHRRVSPGGTRTARASCQSDRNSHLAWHGH